MHDDDNLFQDSHYITSFADQGSFWESQEIQVHFSVSILEFLFIRLFDVHESQEIQVHFSVSILEFLFIRLFEVHESQEIQVHFSVSILEFLFILRLFDVHESQEIQVSFSVFILNWSSFTSSGCLMSIFFVSKCKQQSIYYLKGQYMSNKMIATGWTGIIQIHHEVVLQRCCRGFTGVWHHATWHFQPPDYLARGCSSTLQLQHGYHAHWQQKVSGTLTF